ncbi:MAG: type II toxin-antitoxin system VapC family toxin [Gammaproteobacteria bacterium]
MLLVDSNVILDVLCDDPTWAQWSRDQLRARSLVHPLAINGVVYAEVSVAFNSMANLDKAMDALGLRVLEIPRPALFLAGKAFVQYRRRGGVKQSILADFMVGAHAAVAGVPVLTRDGQRYRSYFPTVEVISPD